MTLPQIAFQTFPSDVSTGTLASLLEDVNERELFLKAIIRRFEQRYVESLEALEARLRCGEGQEHPDWEDSIEWRNALEALQRTRAMRRLLEWLLHSIAPSPVS